jgi:multiple sugar transport system ATP-binding protein
MRGGQILQIGPPGELYERPATLFVADFVGNPMINLLRGHVRQEASSRGIAVGPLLVPGAVDLADRYDVVVAVRPEDWLITAAGSPAIIEQVQPTGADLLLVARLGEGTVLIRAAKDMRVTAGDEIRLAVPGHKVNVFDPATEQVVAFRPAAQAAGASGQPG